MPSPADLERVRSDTDPDLVSAGIPRDVPPTGPVGVCVLLTTGQVHQLYTFTNSFHWQKARHVARVRNFIPLVSIQKLGSGL